jgi:hypothetical protein
LNDDEEIRMIRSTIAVLAVSLAGFTPTQGTNPKPPAAPAQETAATFLARAENRVYQPAVEGLESLAFKVNREYAPGKSLWSISVKWTSAAGATVEGSVSGSAPIAAAMKSQVEASLPSVGEVLASEQTGRFLTYLQSVATPKLDGSEKGLSRVRLSPKAGGKAGFAEKVLLFDNDHVLRKARTTQQDRSILFETYDWRPADEGGSQLLLKSVTASLKVQGMDITRVTTYSWMKIERWHLFSSQGIKTSGIPNSPVRNEDLQLASFVVNGKPVEVR